MRRGKQYNVYPKLPLLAIGFVGGLVTMGTLTGHVRFPWGRSTSSTTVPPKASITGAERDSSAAPERVRSKMRNDVPRETPIPTPTAMISEDVAELRKRGLLLPIENVNLSSLRDSFDQPRGGHTHEAIDMLAARNTVVRAVDTGRVTRLFKSKAGGITVYQFDQAEEFCYYYAHLERYADGLEEGHVVRRGDVIGYVGTSGNAPPDTPHLHFAIFKIGVEKQWWRGEPIDPYPVFVQ